MAFQSLISGSECGVAANPLAQVLKHTEGDRSLQQDRISGPSTSNIRQLPGTGSAANEQDLTLARQFFDAQHQQHRPLVPDPGALLLVPRPLDQHIVQHGIHSQTFGLDFGGAWQAEQQKLSSPAPGLSSWVNEFSSSAVLQSAGPYLQTQNATATMQSDSQRPLYLPTTYALRSPAGTYNLGWPGLYANANLGHLNQSKGKGKEREIDFEAAFEQVTTSLASTQLDAPRIEEITEDTKGTEREKSEFGLYRSWIEQGSSSAPEAEDMAKWEAEFNQLMSSQRDELDYGSFMQEAWENGIGDFSDDNPLLDKFVRFDDQNIPILDNYVFEKNNKYVDPSKSSPTASLLRNAKALLEANGSLSEAALMLEAAIQGGDLGEGGYEAWILLGETRAMDEREDAGMRAMMQGVKLAEAAGTPGPGMLSLAISFTNESYSKAAHVMLLRWLRAAHPEHPVPEDTIQAMKTNSVWDTHTRMTDLFISLARTQHSHGVVDPDVQAALGVLFYTNNEYDRARDCFQAALNVRPKDYLLWNRLGSSLSNGDKPEESLGAYREALSLRPTYTRAIYNVGVACLNIGAYKESAEHFLSALNMQESINGDTSDQLWHTLRRALEAMERSDLVELTKSKGNLEVFRREGFDF